jgi:polysaccharide export outer membrane protein
MVPSQSKGRWRIFLRGIASDIFSKSWGALTMQFSSRESASNRFDGAARFLILSAFCLTLGGMILPTTGCGSVAVDAPVEPFTPPPAPKPYSPSEALRLFDAPLEEVYRLGEGDVLTLQVWDHAELSGPQIIGPDGRITLPVSGELRVAGMTREEAARSIKEAFSKSFEGIVVTVRVDQYIANRVIVLGKVKTPGVLRFETQPTLLEALSRAGGMVDDPLKNLSHCAVIRGRDRIAWLDLRALLDAGDLSLNLRLKPNDLILVPEWGDLPVYALGQVTKPGPYRWVPGMTVLDVLAQAGGLTRDANTRQLYLVRPSRNERRVLDQSELLEPVPGANVAVERGDIFFVPSSVMAEVGYLFEKLQPFAWVFVATQVK